MLFGFPSLERLRLKARLAAARRDGRGLFVRDWHFAERSPDDADELLAWMKETLASCRRPWGVASFDVALATRCERGIRSTRFTRLEPMQLYSTEFRESLLTRLAPAAAGAYTVSAALFSWGEAVYDATGTAAI